MESRMLPLSLGALHDRRQSKDQMHEMLAGIPRASAENPQRVPDELPALQSADYVRCQFGRQEYPPGSHERQRAAHGARSPAKNRKFSARPGRR